MSMAKNTAVFHRLPNNTWGLLAWYPAATERRTETATGDSKKSTKTKQKRKRDNKKKAAVGGTVAPKTAPVETAAHKVVYSILADGELHSQTSILAKGKEAGVMPIAIYGILRNAKDLEAVGDSYRLKNTQTSNAEDAKVG